MEFCPHGGTNVHEARGGGQMWATPNLGRICTNSRNIFQKETHRFGLYVYGYNQSDSQT